MPKQAASTKVPGNPGQDKNKKTSTTTEKPTSDLPDRPRRLQPQLRKWYKPQTWLRHEPLPSRSPLPKARHLAISAGKILLTDWKLFAGLAVIYGLLNLVLVSGFSDPTSLGEFKLLLDEFFSGTFAQLQSVATSFFILLGTSNSQVNEMSGMYQSVLLILASLASIWAIRQTMAGNIVRVRDAYYKGMYPLIPFLFVLIVLSIQLIPALIGSYLLGLAVNGDIVNGSIETILVSALFILLVLWSLRMITTSIFALYIVTLPDMTPVKALKSARDLVRGRRLQIWRKLLLLPISLVLAAALIELPLIWFLTPLAYWVFFAYSTVAVLFIHAYIYVLYRKML